MDVPSMTQDYIRRTLIIIHSFIGVTAGFGGVQLLITNGFGMPLTFLENSPFSSFVIPALILSLIVGGTQLIAAFMLMKKADYAYELSAVASFGILIWTFTQLYVIRETLWLQVVYFALGIFSLTLLVFLEKYAPQLKLPKQLHNRQWYE